MHQSESHPDSTPDLDEIYHLGIAIYCPCACHENLLTFLTSVEGFKHEHVDGLDTSDLVTALGP